MKKALTIIFLGLLFNGHSQSTTNIDLANNVGVRFHYNGGVRAQILANNWGDFIQQSWGRTIMDLRSNNEFWVRDAAYNTVFAINPTSESYIKTDFRIDNKLTVLGQVGIGAEPDSELTVKGVIHTQEVKVDLLGYVVPDYVFNDEYDLMSLVETEDYIIRNKHLPEIPSASEMGKEGIELKAMNLKLLKKIEELTLHLIEQDKKIKVLESRMDETQKD